MPCSRTPINFSWQEPAVRILTHVRLPPSFIMAFLAVHPRHCHLVCRLHVSPVPLLLSTQWFCRKSCSFFKATFNCKTLSKYFYVKYLHCLLTFHIWTTPLSSFNYAPLLMTILVLLQISLQRTLPYLLSQHLRDSLVGEQGRQVSWTQTTPSVSLEAGVRSEAWHRFIDQVPVVIRHTGPCHTRAWHCFPPVLS